MSGNKEKLFLKEAQRVAFDYKHRAIIRFNISRYDTAVEKGRHRYKDLGLARNKAAGIKRKVLADLPDLLEEFEKNATANGSEVFWAQESNEAGDIILKILGETNAQAVVKSKSMTSEEVHLNEKLEKAGIDSFETDLGEFIVQIAGEKPYHIVTPAMHKSKKDIASLFHEKFSTPPDASPEEITAFVRQKLRKAFRTVKVGITGANFLLAKEGAIALTENEGNGFLSYSFPGVHIVLAGIEKILPSLQDLDLMWPLLASHGTGQKVTVYNSVVFGPRNQFESDGPERMVIILLDNGRSHLYSLPEQGESLACIRCGACLNCCPVYKNIGGYTYNSVYSGPIGSVITPHLRGLSEYQHLSFASSLCGKCAEVCPVKIPLPSLLLKNRRDAVNNHYRPWLEGNVMKVMEKGLMSRKLLNVGTGKVRNRMLKLFGMSKIVGDRRTFPEFANVSFNKQWLKRQK
jgi:L-lactate dehydrogenase complex protein LldF